MTRVIALKRHNYAQRLRRKGEIYEARPMDVRFLAVMKYAEPYTKPPLPKPSPEPVPPEHVIADAEVEERVSVVDLDSLRPKRRYRRRDLKAED